MTPTLNRLLWGRSRASQQRQDHRVDEGMQEALHPYSAGGAYVNFLMDEGEERIKATYRDNYQRLVAVKNLYDPTNLFRVNQNIKPTV